MTAIEVNDVSKQYKNGVWALNNISLKVKKGEIFTLLGKNGVGKSTLIRILTTFLPLEQGTVNILGKDIITEAEKIRSHIACVAQQISIDTHLSLRENMRFQGSLYHIPKRETEQRMKSLIDAFQLHAYADKPPVSYSGGIKRRLDIAMHMMSAPDILFLDEPTTGMDVISRNAMWAMMFHMRDHFHTTIVITTHDLKEAEQLSDTICIIKEGKEVIQGTPAQLKNLLHQHTLQLTFALTKTAEEQLTLIKSLYPDMHITLKQNNILFHSLPETFTLEACLQALFQHKISVTGAELMQPSLEDIFLYLTQQNQEVQG